ncbi:hypothetical protein Sp245p_03405 [Azospirillum baldaniorum]|uniref:Uncharacterized protein n=1 Tax=Azospirillum baldaniorum TaxID=1064539 RepID=A0A9P1NN23_9PROT|nr:hypothetical protein [Azospirillum baldaniorum]AWJ88901.1 hypothetical protein Sp245p_03405 [Azospirillum baldaniorum]TWA73389.1 hypothetical protein FBZ85_11681 [Azospirillum brasilense]CCC99392.1 protein of unknown function [Azospirillum baldaniorum]
MNEAEIIAELDAIAAMLPDSGAYAGISISHTDRRYGERSPISIQVYPRGIGKSEALYFRAATFAEAIASAKTGVVDKARAEVEALVRKMALSVIEITADHGECTERLLLIAGFDSSAIAIHHKTACERANAMTSEPREYAVIFA